MLILDRPRLSAGQLAAFEALAQLAEGEERRRVDRLVLPEQTLDREESGNRHRHNHRLLNQATAVGSTCAIRYTPLV